MSGVKTAFMQQIGIDVPIFGFSHCVEVTGAISNAGGMGVYGIAHEPPERVKPTMDAVRALAGDRPIGVDIMMPRNMPETGTLEEVQAALPIAHKRFVEDLFVKYNVPSSTQKTFYNSILRTPAYFEGQLEALMESDVDLVAFGIGLTEDAVQRLKAKGKTVGALVGSPRHFEAYRDVGLDFIVAQGTEAGAHTGSVGTMVLVPEIVEMAGDLPVLAAGGIGHGSQIAAALAMGAQGVWLGTAWLATAEHATGDHATSEKLRRKLIETGSMDTELTRGSSGKPQRQTRSAWTAEWNAESAPAPLGMPYQHALVGDLITAVLEHDVDPLLHSPAGQGVVWTRSMQTVNEVMEQLCRDMQVGLKRAGDLRVG
jgi:NAD(P)H-dependent flavin oxidoreductase YrpB (nitropropane dioxygenase family)